MKSYLKDIQISFKSNPKIFLKLILISTYNFSCDENLKNSQWMNCKVDEMRKIISETMKNEKIQKDLAPILYYDDELLLSPDEWIELMGETDDSRLACDLPFVQLTANVIKRNISLVIIKQKDVQKNKKTNDTKNVNDQKTEDEMLIEDEINLEEKCFTVFGEESSGPPLTMLYFPEGQFQSDAHFESLRKDRIDTHILQKLNELEMESTFDKFNAEDSDGESDVENDPLDDDFNVVESKTKGNAFNQTTLLTPQDPASSVIVNDTKKVVRKKLKRGPTHKTYDIAPGQARKPQEWLREPTFDIDAFPHLHPKGKFGLHYQRTKKLSPSKYFAQRLLNYNDKFAKDEDYVFMAQQYVERHLLENNISLSMKSGNFVENFEGKQVLKPSEDKYSIFQSIPGTPSYWQKFRNEIYARMEQLGPFHLFYTMSCAEMRWPSVLAEVFRKIGNGKIKIYYPHDVEVSDSDNSTTESSDTKFYGEWEDIEVEFFRDDGILEEITIKNKKDNSEITKKTRVNLLQFKEWYFEQKKTNMRSFLKDHFILITRIFDKKVKDFHTELFTKMGIVNYAYRVEFQLRGLPHIHGVAWLDDTELEGCLDEKGIFSNEEDKEVHIKKLIDKWVSCSLEEKTQINIKAKKENEDETDQMLIDKANIKLIQKVKESNVHRHTDSCRKYGTACRYDFPRFFTDETIIAKELSKDLTEEEKKDLFAKQQLIFNKVAEGYKKLDCKSNDPNEANQYDHCFGKFLVEVCELNPIEDPTLFIDEESVKFNNPNVSMKNLSSDEESVESTMDIPSDLESVALKCYKNALSFTEKGRKIFLKRKISERFVNNYNPLIHYIWNANTDIQIATDTHAVISYITDYMTKSDKGLSKELATALKEKKHANKFEQLNYIKQVYFTHKQTCICEATYRLIPGLNLKSASIKALTLTSGFPENRKKMAFSKGEDTREDGFEIEGMDGNYEFKANRFEYYENRPKDTIEKEKEKKDLFYEGEILSLITDKDDKKQEIEHQNPLRKKYFNGLIENLCFAEFNMKYERVSKSSIASIYHFVTCLAKRTEEEMEKDREKRKKRQKKTMKKNETKKRKGNKGIKINEKESDSTDSTEDSDPPLPPYKVTAGIGFHSKVDVDDKTLPPYIFIIIDNIEVYFKLRKKPFILKTYRGKRKDPTEELYSELILFTSWRNEKETFKSNHPNFSEIIETMCQQDEVENDNQNEMPENENSEQSSENEIPDYLVNIEKKGNKMDENRKKIYPYTDKMKELKILLEEAEFLRNSEMEDILDPAGEQQNAEDELKQDEAFVKDILEDEEFQSAKSSKSSSKKEKIIFKIPTVEDGDTLKKKIRDLSYEQRVVFDLFIDFVQKVKCAFMYRGNIDPVPPKIIVHGGGGVGKSFLIDLVSQWTQKILATWGDIADYPKLTKFAFTGAAAYLIGEIFLFVSLKLYINIDCNILSLLLRWSNFACRIKISV